MSQFDLKFTREVSVTPEELWNGWTNPQLLVQWFTPAPWVTTSAEVDLVPGGRFSSIMQGPDGTKLFNQGCYLVVERPRRLVWTSTMTEGFVPAEQANPGFHFTAELIFEPIEMGTRYTARVIHGNEADMNAHESLGFHEGWNIALDQLVALLIKK